MDRFRRPAIVAIIAMLIVATVVFVSCTLNQRPNPTPVSGAVTVYVWDVGEALSVLINDDNTEILIDAGNDCDGSSIAQKVAPYVTEGAVEHIIATHSHADHRSHRSHRDGSSGPVMWYSDEAQPSAWVGSDDPIEQQKRSRMNRPCGPLWPFGSRFSTASSTAGAISGCW